MRHRTQTTRGFTLTGGFTLIELLVVIAIIALLISIGFVAFSGALRAAGGAADGAAIRSIRLAIETFEQDHGFKVPLVYDGGPFRVQGPAVLRIAGIAQGGDGAPVYENQNVFPPIKFVSVYSTGKDLDFLRGGKDASGTKVLEEDLTKGLADARYSKFSLAIYLAGTMPAEIDGRDGALMSEPVRDGSFKGTSRRGTAKTFESYLPVGENEAFSSRVLYGNAQFAQSEIREFDEQGGTKPGGSHKYTTGLLDRYGVPYRYYRWEHGRSTAGMQRFGGKLGEVSLPADLNIPAVLQDLEAYAAQLGGDRDADGARGNPRLKAAKWAVVSAGRDGLFGTEAPLDLGLPGSAGKEEILSARIQAASDNVVEVGP